MRTLAVVVACLVALASPSWSQTPQADLWVTNGPVHALAASGGTLYLGGQFTRIGPPTGSYLALDGATGAIAGADPAVVGSVWVSIPDGSGGRFIAGDFTYVQGQPRNNVAHLDAGGNVLPWNPGAFNGPIDALAIDSSNPGVLYMGGFFTLVNGATHGPLAAADVTTGALTSWAPAINGSVYALAARSGAIYVGGDFHSIGGLTRNHLAAVDGSGAVLPWDPEVNDIVYTIVPFALPPPLNTVTIFIGGKFTSVQGQARYAIASIDASGNPTSWSPNGDHAVLTIALTHNPKGALTGVYAGGTFDIIGALPRQHLALLDPGTGSASTTWVPEPNGTVNSIVLDGSTLYVGGAFDTIAGVSRSYLAALDGTTGAATSWDPSPNLPVLTVGAGGGVVNAGGYFTSLGGLPRANLAAVNTATGAATAWNPGADGAVQALAIKSSTIFAGGRFTHVAGQARQFIAAIDNVGSATAWAPNANSFVNALVFSGNTLYVGGQFNSIGGQSRTLVAALDATTGVPTSWSPNVVGAWVNSLALSGSLIYIGGRFGQVGSLARTGLAALSTAGDLPTAWDPTLGGVPPEVFAIAPVGNTVMAGGDFDYASPYGRYYLAAIDSAGLATRWDPSTDFVVHSMLPLGYTVLVGGIYSHIAGVPRSCLAAVNVPGQNVFPWDPNVTGDVQALTLAGSTIYLGGDFRGVGGWPHGFLAGVFGGVTGVGDTSPRRADPLRLSSNPSRAAVGLGFALPVAATAEVEIFDTSGRMVRRIHPGPLDAGDHELAWDGRDDAGNRVACGIYLVRVHAGALDLRAKAVRLK